MNGIFRISRHLEPGRYRLRDVFPDIRTCGILSRIFADDKEIDEVVERIHVFVVDVPYEMFVNNDDGAINIGLTHLRKSSDEFLYLDIVHELCHVKQHRQGRDLYDRQKAYVDRETEIEAYRVNVEEARRIGMNEDAIRNYLRVSWITPEEHERLVRRLGVAERSASDA
ncbi:MAG: hypothetical protein PHY31_09430 [Smithellaceae bacterium]|nr:hypothetical protein [Smithellaceae bacterium]